MSHSKISDNYAYHPNGGYYINYNRIITDYGINYNSKGGGFSENVGNFARRLVGNRLMMIYLKYLGLKTLNAATLVPFALLFGRDVFKSVIDRYNNREITQKGGIPQSLKIVNKKLPFIDDPLIGSYLALFGLTTLDMTPATLLPLGVLMILYDTYLREDVKPPVQTGGKIIRSLDYFKPVNQSGGGSNLFGVENPPNIMQNLTDLYNGNITSIKPALNNETTNVSAMSNTQWESSLVKGIPSNGTAWSGINDTYTTKGNEAAVIPKHLLPQRVPPVMAGGKR